MPLFSELSPSTLTAQGFLSNVKFNEKDLIHIVEPDGRISKITCNYGEKFNVNYKEPEIRKKTTNRGRKPKPKKKERRKNQGSGKYFNSQITFWISSLDKADKYYKVKVFRNGTVEIPGGLDPFMKDIESAVHVVADKLKDCMDKDVKIVELYSIMRNYKFEMINKEMRVNIGKLYNIFVENQKDEKLKVENITEIKYNIERYPGLIVKFSTPIERNKNKQTTLKMFQSGKVNIDGAVSESCAKYYYEWISNFYMKNKDEAIYKPLEHKEDSSSDSSSDSEPDDK